MDIIKKNADLIKTLFFYTLMGIVIGACVGFCEAIFCKGLNFIFAFRKGKEVFLLPLMPLVGLLIAFVFVDFGGKSREGMGLVFKLEQGKEEEIPLRLIPIMIVSTWLSHLVGCSVGREGVAVQIGADVSAFFGRFIKFKDSNIVFVVTGIAAGFAGLFGTPCASVFFALEVLVAGALQYMSLCPALVAAFTSNYVASLFGVVHENVALSVHWNISIVTCFKVVCMGILFGLVGQLFAFLLGKIRFISRLYIKNPYLRIFVMGSGLALLFFVCGQGRYSGLGTNLVQSALNSGTIYPWDWVCKMLFTVFCLSAGFQGGEVTPLFAIGASLGLVLARLFGLPLALGAALGYVAVFGAGTNTFLAPIAIGLELFGPQYFYLFFIVCSVSYLFNKDLSIYSLQEVIHGNE